MWNGCPWTQVPVRRAASAGLLTEQDQVLRGKDDARAAGSVVALEEPGHVVAQRRPPAVRVQQFPCRHHRPELRRVAVDRGCHGVVMDVRDLALELEPDPGALEQLTHILL